MNELYFAFILTSAFFIVTPGPNVALILSNSLAHNTKYGMTTIAGISSAMTIQITLTLMGMTTLLTLFSDVFEWIRWVGVVYLIYLGIQKWLKKSDDLTAIKSQKKSLKHIYWQGFVVSLLNPKTMLFYSAFFPQFINTELAVTPQFMGLGITFFFLALVIDSSWVLLAGKLRPLLMNFNTLYDRISGAFLICAGFGLAFARKD